MWYKLSSVGVVFSYEARICCQNKVKAILVLKPTLLFESDEKSRDCVAGRN